MLLRTASCESLSGGRGMAKRSGRGRGTGTTTTRAVSSSSAPRAPHVSVLDMWRTCDAVAFDVDSTVCEDEGIDELGAYVGAGERVEAITKKAMEGGMPFGEALQARLEAMAITREQLETYVAKNPPKYSPGIKELIAALRASGKEVYLVSGGFRQMIAPVAKGLGIPVENIYANTITFNEDGSLKGYDAGEFTSRSGGKAEAVKHIKSSRGYNTMVMVGDGATDLEAKIPGGADIVVGYGGAQRRAKVEAEADWFVLDLFVLAETLKGA